MPCAATASIPSFSPRPPARRNGSKLVAEYSTGFVYLVSRTGVTGERDSLSHSVGPLVERPCAPSRDLPLAVGFGISTPEQVATVGSMADGVAVGSAFVRTVETYGASGSWRSALEQQARDLASGLHAAAAPVGMA